MKGAAEPVKLVGKLLAGTDAAHFDPLASEIWFCADGDTYLLVADAGLRQQAFHGSWINFNDDVPVHVKAIGEVKERADNIAQFIAASLERIDL